MRTIRPFLALVLLGLAASCQAARPASDLLPAARDREIPAGAAALEAPDPDTLSARPLPPPEQFVPVPRLADIHFDYDSHAIRPEAAHLLEGNAEWLRTNPDGLVLVEGHTDERGTGEYNLGLGDLRARAAMLYLIAQGVPAERMVAISYGEERRACPERTEACWARNRRVRFLIKPL
jgi:peptidoglycan-associated lipoprotein